MYGVRIDTNDPEDLNKILRMFVLGQLAQELNYLKAILNMHGHEIERLLVMFNVEYCNKVSSLAIEFSKKLTKFAKEHIGELTKDIAFTWALIGLLETMCEGVSRGLQDVIFEKAKEMGGIELGEEPSD